MQVLKSIGGVRSLKRIAATASSARVLNLHAIAIEAPEHPDYADYPMFAHPVLNRAIIVKHNVRPDEEDRMAPRRFSATKVIFPFDKADLSLGGQFLFVDQSDFYGLLTRHLDYTELPIERDLAVLRSIDKLPTLDPFLVREVLKQQRIEVGRCYYQFSRADKAEMLSFAAGEIETLIRMCVGELKTNDRRTQRLSQLLLADQDSAELEPLRQAFGMGVAEFSEAMFSWKALLYYRWRSRALTPALKATLKSIGAVQAWRYERDELSFILRSTRVLETVINTAWREVGHRLRLYDRAFASLTHKESPDSFRAFLTHSSSLFVELGERIGRLEQTISFWNDRFGTGRIADLSTEEAIEALRDLLQALAIKPAEPGVSKAA